MRTALLCSFILLLCTCVRAQESTDWTVDDIIATESMSSVQLKKSKRLTTDDKPVAGFTVSRDGKWGVFNHSTTNQIPKYYVANFANSAISQPVEIVKLNGKLAKKRITKSEVIEWKGWNDEMVNGLLFYPEDYQEGRAYPLMLSIHGGPAGADLDRWSERWSTYPQVLAQRGAFVLKPNYHGSSNHGYDLGGDVAEFAADGKVYGYGAYNFVDATGEGLRSDQPLGFRVMMDK
jgi:dipeptidyl aminopeptidase/acylaminoacyl peptidase